MLYSQGLTTSGHRAFQTWKNTYTDVVNDVQIIIIDDAFVQIGYQHNVSALAHWPNVHTIYLGGITSVYATANRKAEAINEKM